MTDFDSSFMLKVLTQSKESCSFFSVFNIIVGLNTENYYLYIKPYKNLIGLQTIAISVNKNKLIEAWLLVIIFNCAIL